MTVPHDPRRDVDMVSAWPRAPNTSSFLVGQLWLCCAQKLPNSQVSDPSTSPFLSPNCSRGVFDLRYSRARAQTASFSSQQHNPEPALTGNTMPAYEIASLLLSTESFITVLRAANGPCYQLELLVVASVPFIHSVPELSRVCYL